jgi:saccharopine dehydrogenase-like NADP-dependent oxidoreductase
MIQESVKDAEMAVLRQQAADAGIVMVLGCGIGSPGMTEMSARYLAEELDRVDELYIQCGGIPENPKPPLDYKIVFGGQQMPLVERDVSIIENGKLKIEPRCYFDGTHHGLYRRHHRPHDRARRPQRRFLLKSQRKRP